MTTDWEATSGSNNNDGMHEDNTIKPKRVRQKRAGLAWTCEANYFSFCRQNDGIFTGIAININWLELIKSLDLRW